MGELQPDALERALIDYQCDRYDPARLSELVAYALVSQDDDLVAAMLRRGGQLLIHPLNDGRAEIVVAYTEDSEMLAELRASVWDGEPERPPAYGDSERGAMLVLATFPVSVLAALPRG